MIVKEHKVLTLEKVIEKAESNPPHKVIPISFLKINFYWCYKI